MHPSSFSGEQFTLRNNPVSYPIEHRVLRSTEVGQTLVMFAFDALNQNS